MISNEEMALLKIAKDDLENPNLFIKLSNFIGTPIEILVDKLPESGKKMIGGIVNTALTKSLEAAKYTIVDGTPSWWQTIVNRAAVTVSGGVGGALGIAAAAVEIPISTTMFFREMTQKALIHGFDVKDPSVCMEVIACFSYGSPHQGDDSSETGYFAVRAALAKQLTEVADYFAQKLVVESLDNLEAPVIVALMNKIASRFGVVVADELAAKCVPILGAAGGIAINNLFMHHYSCVSDAHFFILKMEKKYGQEEVKKAYDQIVG